MATKIVCDRCGAMRDAGLEDTGIARYQVVLNTESAINAPLFFERLDLCTGCADFVRDAIKLACTPIAKLHEGVIMRGNTFSESIKPGIALGDNTTHEQDVARVKDFNSRNDPNALRERIVHGVRTTVYNGCGCDVRDHAPGECDRVHGNPLT